MQAVPDTKSKTLYVVSSYINKNGASQLVNAKKAPTFTPETASVITPKEGITQELHDELSSLSTTSETKLASLPSKDSISKDKGTVNIKDMQDGEIYSQGKRVSFEKGERVGGKGERPWYEG